MVDELAVSIDTSIEAFVPNTHTQFKHAVLLISRTAFFIILYRSHTQVYLNIFKLICLISLVFGFRY